MWKLSLIVPAVILFMLAVHEWTAEDDDSQEGSINRMADAARRKRQRRKRCAAYYGGFAKRQGDRL